MSKLFRDWYDKKCEEGVVDNYEEHKLHTTPDPQCSSCYKPSCEYCHGEGSITRTEWTDTDTSYPVTRRCICQED